MFSEIDLQYYVANKALVSDAKQGIAIKRSGPFAGLRNHGATCYLNSLIQCLFHDKDFVKLILETSDNKDSVIIAELQKLFARLMLSANQAIDTEQLLAAFGWSKSQMFEQHDIHELFSVLLDALGKDSAHLNAEIAKLFQGHLSDVLTCSSCAHTSRNASSFINFSLDMPDIEANKSPESAPYCVLNELIRTHLTPEVLDEENKWQCSGCGEKVRATKAQEYQNLPQLMMVHLKRFRYDPVLKRRRKLTTPVHFPLTLDANELFKPSEQGSKSTSYRLTGVVLHSGTAMGGHYRSYLHTVDATSNTPVWVDCNDANVTALSDEDIQKMLSPETTTDSGFVAGKSSFVHDNVYMLLYKAVENTPLSSLEELKQLVSVSVKEEIERENASFAERFRLQEIRSQVVDLTVRVHAIGAAVEASTTTAQVDLLQHTTLADALVKVHAVLVSENKLHDDVYPVQNCRLRKYGKRNTTILGESFEGREGTTTLQAIGLSGAATLGLEVRASTDAEFVEFNPYDMHLSVSLWAGEGVQGEKKDLLVPGREASTVGALRAAVAQALSVAPECVVLVHDDPAQPIALLSSDEEVLVAQHQIYPGDNSVIVEVLPDAAFSSVAFGILESKRSRAVIYYNNPLLRSETADPADPAAEATETDTAAAPASSANRDSTYTFSLEVSVDLTLSAVKALIAPTLGISDANSFYCKRSGAASAPQLKDENKTLKELAIVSHSVLHLQLGQGCKVGEHMVRIEIDTSSPTSALQALDATTSTGVAAESGGIAGAAAQVFIPLGELAVSEKLSVLQLKTLLLEQWATLASAVSADCGAVPVPLSANHIRLRDGKAGKSSGPLRDDRIVGRCLLGLADGRRLVAQVLSEAEFISADDLVISLRVASFERKVLYPAIDLPITRTSSIKALYEKILALVPQLNEPLPAEYVESVPAEPEYTETISIAKGFTTGPALTLKSAFKLKWDDPAVLKALVEPVPEVTTATVPAVVQATPAAASVDGEEEGTIDPAGVPVDGVLNNPFGLDRPPLNLRDGSIVVVRSKADFWRVEQILKARKAEEIAAGGDGAPRRPTTAGTGAAAARNRKSVKARVAAANAGMVASESGGEDEVLVKGAPKEGGGGIVRSNTEKSLKIASAGERSDA